MFIKFVKSSKSTDVVVAQCECICHYTLCNGCRGFSCHLVSDWARLEFYMDVAFN